MKRKIYEDLIQWKNQLNPKPLLVLGQRQIGKTYIIRKFGKNEFKHFIEINLMENLSFLELFNKTTNIKELINIIFDSHNISINEAIDSLIFIDEIQESSRALTLLKFINDSKLNVRIICSGSYLGYKLRQEKTSFPIGQVEFLFMKQMSFEEYIWAINKTNILDNVINCIQSSQEYNDFYHEELIKYYNQYLIIGGFPEAIKTYIDNQNDVTIAHKILKAIYLGYLEDIDKYATIFNDQTFLRLIFRNINKFLVNENKKFKFRDIDENAKFRELEKFIIWLEQSNLIYKVNNLKNLSLPLINNEIYNNFKLYYNDHGFISVNHQLTNINNPLFNQIKGGLVENYVIDQIKYEFEQCYFYSFYKDNHRYEIDLIVLNNNNEVCAIEIKSGSEFKTKSLNHLNIKHKYVLSPNKFSVKDKYINIPIYLAFKLKDLIN